ncbi:MAG: hypothetical protein EA415_03570 [Sphaerobacteraceae bacterium]|nr:MAG: hypothetical protein EA415_03570 [Sphaerobacteraceae bacterium]
MDPRADFTERNITLSFEFARSIVDNPSILDEIPDGATLILLPSDEPDLVRENFRLGIAVAERGENVYLRHVSSPSSAASHLS